MPSKSGHFEGPTEGPLGTPKIVIFDRFGPVFDRFGAVFDRFGQVFEGPGEVPGEPTYSSPGSVPGH